MVKIPFEEESNYFINACNPTDSCYEIPVVNLSDPLARNLIVEACQEFGIFKVVNHGIPFDLMNCLEKEALRFFNLSQAEKDKAGPPDPFGYGSKKIGRQGDVGSLEYIMLNSNPDVISPNTLLIFRESPEIFSSAVNKYMDAVKKLSSGILEMMADGLKIEPRAFSKHISDERSDSCFRLNFYPPLPKLQYKSGQDLLGFGEHTDPQIVSILRSNNVSGLQISLKDGTWVSVSPDQTSFFVIVGDSLQVMTNGRFRSVKHRVMSDAVNPRPRVSMIYFGGPPLNEKIAPLTSLMTQEEESLYEEFTWSEYKAAAYKTRLSDNRLKPFEKASSSRQ